MSHGWLRPLLISGLYLLGTLNGLSADVVVSISLHGIAEAVANTFNISVVVAAAALVGLGLARRSPERRIDQKDLLAWGICFAALLIPRSGASWVALTFVAIYEVARGRRCVETTAAASLFLGIAVTKLWASLALNIFAPFFLSLDAAVVAGLLDVLEGGGVRRSENLIDSASGQPLAVMLGCASLANLSYGLLAWATCKHALMPGWRWDDLPAACAVAVSVVVLNLLRMTVMGVSYDWFLLAHGSVGANVFSILVLVIPVAIACAGVRTQTRHADRALGVPGSRGDHRAENPRLCTLQG